MDDFRPPTTDTRCDIELLVPGLHGRDDIRAVSRVIADVAGVVTTEVDLANCRVRVCGAISAGDLLSVLADAGFSGVRRWPDLGTAG